MHLNNTCISAINCAFICGKKVVQGWEMCQVWSRASCWHFLCSTWCERGDPRAPRGFWENPGLLEAFRLHFHPRQQRQHLTDKRAHVLDWRTWPRPLLAEDSGCQPADNKLIISSWIIILWLTGCKQLLHDAPDAEAPCERFHLEEIKQRSAPGTIAPVLWIYFSWCF